MTFRLKPWPLSWIVTSIFLSISPSILNANKVPHHSRPDASCIGLVCVKMHAQSKRGIHPNQNIAKNHGSVSIYPYHDNVAIPDPEMESILGSPGLPFRSPDGWKIINENVSDSCFWTSNWESFSKYRALEQRSTLTDSCNRDSRERRTAKMKLSKSRIFDSPFFAYKIYPGELKRLGKNKARLHKWNAGFTSYPSSRPPS